MLNKLRNLYRSKQANCFRNYINDLILEENFKKVINVSPKTKKKVLIVTPTLLPHAGGCTSILRLGTYLNEYGYKTDYVSHGPQGVEELKKIAKSNLENYKGEIYAREDMKRLKADIIIATDWASVYHVKRMDGYKMYFVQDYEPYFYKYDEMYLLAKETYNFGLHMVSLGKWNKDMIEKTADDPTVDYIDFPYEPSEYKMIKRDYKAYAKKRKIKLAVYSKETGKRLPNLLQLIMLRLKERFAKDGIEVEVLFFGFAKDYKVLVGKNLGCLSKKELKNLYGECDFGMVASMTNISLVPYEMLATGLPLIEFAAGTFSYFFPEECAILTDYNYETLYAKIKDVLENPDVLEKQSEMAQEVLAGLGWEKSARQFADIIERI